VIPDVADGGADLEPLEDLRWLALVQSHLFSVLLGRGPVQPFPGQVRRQHHRAPVMDVHHAAGAVGVVHAARRAQLDPAHAQRTISITDEGNKAF